MKSILYFSIFLFFGMKELQGQQFIEKAVIEFEVKTSIKKTMGGGMWEEMMKDNMTDFKTGYFNFVFADDKSIYKFDHWLESMKIPEWFKKSDEEEVWYLDHKTNRLNMQKNVFGSNFNVEDSIPGIEWKLSNETRVIAGYNCRKAIGRIMDSVYVFAFYSDEIAISGGPCSISGLPGMILGLTIPRMYTSWIATKVNVNNVEVNRIVPATAKKYYTSFSLKTMLRERSKDWFSSNDPDSAKWLEQFYWKTSL